MKLLISRMTGPKLRAELLLSYPKGSCLQVTPQGAAGLTSLAQAGRHRGGREQGLAGRHQPPAGLSVLT